MRRTINISMCGVLICLLLAAHALAGDINMMVAASLREVINELSDSFGKRNPGIRFVKNYGASGMLAKQIENAAPADLFISANLEWVDYLKQKKMLDEQSIDTFAYNVLVVAGKPELKVGSLQDLANVGRIAIGSPKSVPAGEYALEAFRKAGIEKRLEKKLIMARDVRECLVYAERGDVDVALVYRTDALLLGKHTKILFVVPQNLYSRVTYPMALTSDGGKKSDAVSFLNFLKSPDALISLKKYGFVPR